MKKYKNAAVILFAAVLCLALNGAQNDDYYNIIKQMGYADVGEKPIEIAEVKIPEKFGKVYENYNNLLKTSGYDLSLYKGKVVNRYTYLIPSVNARANVLVFDGRIIGGDISGITLDGIMIPIRRSDNCET